MPVITVPFGSEIAGLNSKDVAIRNVVAGSDRFRQEPAPDPRQTSSRDSPTRRSTSKCSWRRQEADGHATDQGSRGEEILPITGIKYVPQTDGEKRLTLRVKPKEGELVRSNNTISTYVTVLKGGLNVLFIQGPHSAWEQKYWCVSIALVAGHPGRLKILRTRRRARRAS